MECWMVAGRDNVWVRVKFDCELTTTSWEREVDRTDCTHRAPCTTKTAVKLWGLLSAVPARGPRYHVWYGVRRGAPDGSGGAGQGTAATVGRPWLPSGA